MFFMMGITQGKKYFEDNKIGICNHCGAYGRYQIFMTYMCLSLFFLPCFKWNRKYYVQSTCCHALYLLDPDIGTRIAHGEKVEILPQNLTEIQTGYQTRFKRCSNCGFETQEDFAFCPKCGHKF